MELKEKNHLEETSEDGIEKENAFRTEQGGHATNDASVMCSNGAVGVGVGVGGDGSGGGVGDRCAREPQGMRMNISLLRG